MLVEKRVEFHERGLSVKTLEAEEDILAAYRLRHRIYSQGLKWVPASPNELEVDAYDTGSTSLGLFSPDASLIGVIRLVPAPGPFMLEKEFKPCVMPGYRIRKEADTNEITRLTVDPTLTEKGLSSRLLLMLLKGLYQWSVGNDIRYSYMVVEKRFLRVLHVLGFPCRPISPFKTLPPAGAICVAALLDWDEFRDENALKNPAFLEWMSTLDRGIALEPREAFLTRVGEFVPGHQERVAANETRKHLVAV